MKQTVCIILCALFTLAILAQPASALPPCPPGYAGDLVGVVCDYRTPTPGWSPISPLSPPPFWVYLPCVILDIDK